LNIWIAKVGPQPFSAPVVAALESFHSRNADDYPALNRPTALRHQLSCVDYFSLASGEEFSSKRYNAVDPNTGVLHAYSGLPLGVGVSVQDSRYAKSLASTNLAEATASLRGQYALLRAGPMEFECVVDALGSHKVLYRRTSDGGAYVTNHMWLMRLIGTSGPNHDAVAEWIATGELFGYGTEEDQVFTLPENGRLTWSGADGLAIGQRSSLRAFLAEYAAGSAEDLVHRAATDLRDTAAYLGRHHRIALSLSGGYDSRLMVAMLAELDPNGVECFTYPDHPDDVPLAKEGTRRVLGPALKVRINGIGGDVDKGVNKLGPLEKMRPDQAIVRLIETIARPAILTAEAWEDLRGRLFGYLSEKYLPLLEGSDSPDRLGSMYFHFERFRGLQGYGQSQSALRVSDVYLPFATSTFIGAAFGLPVEALRRGGLGSLHRRLFLALAADRVQGIPFTAGPRWEDRRLARFVAKRRSSIRALIHRALQREKYAWVVHRRFYETNYGTLVKIFERSVGSPLWTRISREAVFALLRKGPSAEMKDIHSLLRIATVLAADVGTDG
jgi:hypothetical protein